MEEFLHVALDAKPCDGGLLLRDIYRLGIICSFPKVFAGRVTWEFPLRDQPASDGYLLVGLTPSPDIKVVQFYLLGAPRVRARGERVLRPEIGAMCWFFRRNGVTLEKLRVRIARSMYATKKAEDRFVKAIAGMRFANTQAIARELGWSVNGAYGVFCRLRKRGYKLPTLVWRANQVVRWRCDGCGDEWDRTVRGLARDKRGLCKPCYARIRAKIKVTVRCVDCGKLRNLTRSAANRKHDSRHPNTKCRICAAMRNVKIAQRESVRRQRLIHRAYRVIAAETVRCLRRAGVQDARMGARGGATRFISIPRRGARDRRYIELVIDVDTAARLMEGDGKMRRTVVNRLVRTDDLWSAGTYDQPAIVSVGELLEKRA